MTPKEKAEDLLMKFSILPEGMNDEVKKCALIAVDEILNDLHQIDEYEYIGAQLITGRILYWQGVKNEF